MVKPLPEELKDNRNTYLAPVGIFCEDYEVEEEFCAICDGQVTGYPGCYGRTSLCRDEFHRTAKLQ